MKVLVIWEEVPESVKAYIVEEIGAVSVALRCSGVYINSSGLTEEQDNDINWLSYEFVAQGYEALDPTTGPLEGPFDKVVVCGFIM